MCFYQVTLTSRAEKGKNSVVDPVKRLWTNLGVVWVGEEAGRRWRSERIQEVFRKEDRREAAAESYGR